MNKLIVIALAIVLTIILYKYVLFEGLDNTRSEYRRRDLQRVDLEDKDSERVSMMPLISGGKVMGDGSKNNPYLFVVNMNSDNEVTINDKIAFDVGLGKKPFIGTKIIPHKPHHIGKPTGETNNDIYYRISVPSNFNLTYTRNVNGEEKTDVVKGIKTGDIKTIVNINLDNLKYFVLSIA